MDDFLPHLSYFDGSVAAVAWGGLNGASSRPGLLWAPGLRRRGPLPCPPRFSRDVMTPRCACDLCFPEEVPPEGCLAQAEIFPTASPRRAWAPKRGPLPTARSRYRPEARWRARWSRGRPVGAHGQAGGRWCRGSPNGAPARLAALSAASMGADTNDNRSGPRAWARYGAHGALAGGLRTTRARPRPSRGYGDYIFVFPAVTGRISIKEHRKVLSGAWDPPRWPRDAAPP